jgi:hypothetical protein
MAFVAAMSAPETKTQGVKGSDVYTEAGVGDLRVTLFTQLVRGCQAQDIDSSVRRIVASGDQQQLRDLAAMIFQTRDIRGGKGEKMLFQNLMSSLAQHAPSLAQSLIPLVPEYGCWKDLWSLWISSPPLQAAIDALVKEQFAADQESERPSLLAKWLPREGSKQDAGCLAKHFASLLFPLTQAGDRLRTYRRVCAFLNKKIDTNEVKMCSKTWSEINPDHVPGRLMKRCKLAFFNQKEVKLGGRRRSVSHIVERYPGVVDRVTCAQHFKEHLEDVKAGKKTMKGGQTTMPHEHVHELLMSGGFSNEKEDTIQAQWNAIRDETLKYGGLGKVVPMCDFSGSMAGIPQEVSLALGVLISEIASPAFRDHILTFDSSPLWHSFVGKTSLQEKIRSIGGIGQGLSTDFQKACDLVLERLVEHKVAPEDAPTDLLVLTDMGFDEACGKGAHSYYTGNSYSKNVKQKPWQTHFQMIRDNFERHGYQPPRIVCWNLRAEYKDYHATAHEQGVVQLSGWSPAVLKALQKEGVTVQTPYEGMRALLDDARYDPVRLVVDGLKA